MPLPPADLRRAWCKSLITSLAVRICNDKWNKYPSAVSGERFKEERASLKTVYLFARFLKRTAVAAPVDCLRLTASLVSGRRRI